MVIAALSGVLEEAQRRGLIGPGPIAPQVEHALGFASAVADVAPAGRSVRAAQAGPSLDLGSGGGLPGLVLAVAWPGSHWFLLDARERSTDFLDEAVSELGVGDRVRVVRARAEEVGRDAAHRGMYPLVVSRGFGPPATTAECAAPLLALGGRLVVSEPPGGEGERWPADGLRVLGLATAAVVSPAEGEATFVVMEQTMMCPSRFPRRVGVPRKRPLFQQTGSPPEP